MKDNIVDFQRIRDSMNDHSTDVANDAVYSDKKKISRFFYLLTRQIPSGCFPLSGCCYSIGDSCGISFLVAVFRRYRSDGFNYRLVHGCRCQ
ncbi:hypothetical protein T636_A4509 (plasmid) [Enterobacter hormaechei subsp. xiangfangensis]|nr:hypothetical protein T636_A4509 [Enterobacter hormaechei subsp. xiangfangensis]